MTTSSFVFPKYFDLPPFFTTQPVLETQKKQTQLWGELILSYCRHHKVFDLSVSEATRLPLFANNKISRSLSVDQIRFFLDSLAAQGNVEWKDKAKSSCFVFFKTPLQWGNAIFQWALDQGKANTVLTVFEIQQGEDAQDQEFFNIDQDTLLKAIKTLEKAGKAQLFSGSGDNMGVKFFSA